MQSVPITTNVVSSNRVHGKVHSIQHYGIKFISTLRQIGGFSGYSVSSTNKTDRRDITEILLKVALNTINQPTILILVSIADLGGPLVYSPVRLCLYFSVGVSE